MQLASLIFWAFLGLAAATPSGGLDTPDPLNTSANTESIAIIECCSLSGIVKGKNCHRDISQVKHIFQAHSFGNDPVTHIEAGYRECALIYKGKFLTDISLDNDGCSGNR